MSGAENEGSSGAMMPWFPEVALFLLGSDRRGPFAAMEKSIPAPRRAD
ncbi:MAG: hypothetical protein ABJF23_16310 [Bryobacteraceae bacterium]